MRWHWHQCGSRGIFISLFLYEGVGLTASSLAKLSRMSSWDRFLSEARGRRDDCARALWIRHGSVSYTRERGRVSGKGEAGPGREEQTIAVASALLRDSGLGMTFVHRDSFQRLSPDFTDGESSCSKKPMVKPGFLTFTISKIHRLSNSWMYSKKPVSFGSLIPFPCFSEAFLHHRTFKIVVKYTQHKIYHFNHFSVYGSVAVSTLLRIRYHHPSMELSASCKTNCVPIQH